MSKIDDSGLYGNNLTAFLTVLEEMSVSKAAIAEGDRALNQIAHELGYAVQLHRQVHRRIQH